MASFAQQRLWMDEKIHFREWINGQISFYNELLIYKLLSNVTISIDRLRQALTTQQLPYNNEDNITYLDYTE